MGVGECKLQYFQSKLQNCAKLLMKSEVFLHLNVVMIMLLRIHVMSGTYKTLK